MRILCPLLVLILTTVLYAQDQPAAVTQACASVANLSLPEADPSAKCEDPAALYYGTHKAPDYAAAHNCALYQWHNLKRPIFNNDDPEGSLMTIGTLVTTYANGEGAPRNVDLAIHIACREDLPSESSYGFNDLIERLLQIKAKPARFDFCSSGSPFGKNTGYDCLGYQEAAEEREHMEPLTKLMAKWTAPQKAGFAKMMKSRSAFTDQEREAEAFDGSGVGGYMMEAEHTLKLGLIDSIIRFDSGHLPSFTHQNYLEADKKLNLIYAKLLPRLPDTKYEGNCKSLQTIRASARAWIAYRDDWVAFAHLRWPQVSTESWLTLLTQERTTQLEDISFCASE